MIMFSLSAAVYVIFGTGILSTWLLGTLEHRYRPLTSTEGLQDVKRIVILAGYGERHAGLPPSSEVNFASAYRLLEGLRIVHQLPDAEILISGGGEVPGIMKGLLASTRLTEQRISIDNLLVHEPKPRNPRLAEAFKRIGIVEQTGRGVDKIYREQLR